MVGSLLTDYPNNYSNNNNNNNELEIIKTQTQPSNKESTKNIYSGNDERYNNIDMEKQIEKEKEELFLIFVNMKKLELLKILQNEKISNLDKIRAIEEYEKYGFNEFNNKKPLKIKSKYTSDILAGIYMHDF
jgi:hypothetical protein